MPDLHVAPVVRPDAYVKMLVHLKCLTCFPFSRMGNVARCGEKLLGVPAPRGSVNCVECERLRAAEYDGWSCPKCRR